MNHKERTDDMKKALTISGLVFLLSAMTAFAADNVAMLQGKWVGEFQGTAGTVQVRTHFWMENDELVGTMDFPQENIYNLKLSFIIIEAASVHFEVVKNSEVLSFEGKLISNQLVGEFSTKTGRGVFGFSREKNL
jgi:hypothetical protein